MLTGPGGASQELQAAGATRANFWAMRCARPIGCIAKKKKNGCIAKEEEEEEESSEEPVEEPEPLKKFKVLTLSVVRYKVHQATGQAYLIHKDADGKDDTANRQPLATVVDKTFALTPFGKVQHQVARSFMDKKIVESSAKHPDGQDLDNIMYKMSFFDSNADVPIVGEEFNIKMGGVTYEVSDGEFGHGKDGCAVKHNGVELDGLLFDIDTTSKTVTQLVGLKDGSKQFRSAHAARVKRLTSPQKKKRTAKTTASELAKKSAGGSAVSLA